MPKVSAIQMNSCGIVHENLKQLDGLLQQAAREEANLVVLPEMFTIMGVDPAVKCAAQEPFGHGLAQDFLAEAARRYGFWIVAGTMPISSEQQEKPYAACLIYNAQGEVAARYNKIHLFNAQLLSGRECYDEAKTTVPGSQVVVVDTPVGRLGVAVCYDLRFPELFRAMVQQQVDIFALPTAFAVPTGVAHWHVLTRARAIENLAYFVGACQTGTHPNGRKTYGHSVIVNPWGTLVAELEEGVGVITAEIDLAFLRQVRKDLPALLHQRLLRGVIPAEARIQEIKG